MKQPYQTTLEALVCKRVKQLLNERNISVRQLATASTKIIHNSLVESLEFRGRKYSAGLRREHNQKRERGTNGAKAP